MTNIDESDNNQQDLRGNDKQAPLFFYIDLFFTTCSHQLANQV